MLSEYILQCINGVGLNPRQGRTTLKQKTTYRIKKSNTVELNSQAYILNYLIQLSILSESGAFVAVMAW